MARLSDIAFTEQPVNPTTKQRMTETLAGLLSFVPFFATLFYDRIKLVWVAPGHWIQTLATDGNYIFANEKWWTEHSIHERIFGICHEILHCAHDDMLRGNYYRGIGSLRGLPYYDEIANLAADFRINDTLVESKIGSMPAGCAHDTSIGVAGELFEDIYEKVFKKFPPKGGGGSGQGKGQQGKGSGQPGQQPGHGFGGEMNPGLPKPFDHHIEPSHTPSPAEQAQRKAEWQQALNAAKTAAKACGNMPGALEALVDQLLDVQVPWTEELKKFMTRHTQGIGARTYKRLNKRKLVFHPQIVMPGRAGFGAENIVLVFDTSGSMSEDQFKQAVSEGAAILTDVRPRTLWVIQGDAEVGDVKRLPEGTGVRELMYRKGFGGTDFRPPFKRVEELGIKPEVLIYFTDLMGPFPEEPPSYPVIWCAVNVTEEAPWGKTIHVKS